MGLFGFLFPKEVKELQTKLSALHQDNDALRVRLTRMETQVKEVPTVSELKEILTQGLSQLRQDMCGQVKKTASYYETARQEEVGHNRNVMSKLHEKIETILKKDNSGRTTVIEMLNKMTEDIRSLSKSSASEAKIAHTKTVDVITSIYQLLEAVQKDLKRLDNGTLPEEYVKAVQTIADGVNDQHEFLISTIMTNVADIYGKEFKTLCNELLKAVREEVAVLAEKQKQEQPHQTQRKAAGQQVAKKPRKS